MFLLYFYKYHTQVLWRQILRHMRQILYLRYFRSVPYLRQKRHGEGDGPMVLQNTRKEFAMSNKGEQLYG